jgi:hypothetical protein
MHSIIVYFISPLNYFKLIPNIIHIESNLTDIYYTIVSYHK